MNIKVVIIWGFAVVVFLAIGIFGYFNQDILTKTNADNTPSNQENRIEYDSKRCVGTNEYGNIIYTYKINPSTNNVERLSIKYQGVVESIDVYADAANVNKIINEQKFKGVTSQMFGTSKDVQLNLNVNLLEYDKNAIDSINIDLIELGMVVSPITDYNEYQNLISSTLNLEFTCD